MKNEKSRIKDTNTEIVLHDRFGKLAAVGNKRKKVGGDFPSTTASVGLL